MHVYWRRRNELLNWVGTMTELLGNCVEHRMGEAVHWAVHCAYNTVAGFREAYYTDLQARSDRHSQSNATSPEHGLRKELRKELRMVPLWATEEAADTPSPSCGAVIYLCGYVFM